MDSLYLLIPVAGVFCTIAIYLLRWAINAGQYEDLDREAWRILQEDATPSVAPAETVQEDHKTPAPPAL